VRSRSSVVLLAIAVAACAPAVASAQYAPKWRVGDWWVVKTWHESVSGEWVWDHTRYDIVGVEKVHKRNCLVVESRDQGPSGRLSDAHIAFYVRMDDWLVVRQVIAYMYCDVLRHDTLECPLGLFGPFPAGEPRLPRFPLRLANQDTAFRIKRRDDCAADLREMARIADPAEVKRLLKEGDTGGGRVVRPTGVVYQVRNECGGNRFPGPPPGRREVVQSFQLWCDEEPWRVYEELVYYHGLELSRDVTERSWLVASGHKKK
jgi:hypothetical protein